MGVLTGIKKGKIRRVMLQLHRLEQFEETFDAYLERRATSNEVKERAYKMLQCGLPWKLK